MYRYNFKNRSVSVTSNFESTKVNDILSKFGNTIEGGWLITTFDGREVCRVEISKIYYNFDFASFSKSILSEIEKYFTPEKYGLKVASGVQEIRLVGDELYIDNERYEKMISIVNSTDKSRALSMNVGLVRRDKGFLYPKYYIILTSFCNKHYKSSLPDKIKAFSDNLINFNMNIDFHIKTINDLKDKDVSIVDFAKSILFDNEGNLIKTVELKLKALSKNLSYHYGLRKNYYSTLYKLNATEINNAVDLKINCKTLYSAYMELFKDSDASVISRESRRIIEALETI